MVVKRYAVALLCAAAAIAIATLMRPFFNGQTLLTPLTIAVILAAAYGGLGPGLVVTVFCAILIYVLPGGSIFSPVFDRPRPLLFLFAGVVISFVIERLRRANARAEAANRELSKRSEALAKSNEELERFAYALSHDLQAPLRTISMFTERVAAKLGPGADEDTATSLRFISEGVMSMQAMIRGLLEYAMASKSPPGAARADVNAVLQTVLHDIHGQIEQSGAQITADPLPAVAADATQIRQVLQNLISNAIQYRSAAPPQIHVGVKAGPREWIFLRARQRDRARHAVCKADLRTFRAVGKEAGRNGDRAGGVPRDCGAQRRADLGGIGAGQGRALLLSLPRAAAMRAKA